MGDLSPNFSRRELADRHTGELLADVSHLVQHLERLRSICGDRPLEIFSGWRSDETNRKVGGARYSQHLLGRAADIPSGYATVAQAEAAGFTGIGEAAGWAVHVDVRPGPPARWGY
jgi:uncharacterized protein YcbK (DUF882 family)